MRRCLDPRRRSISIHRLLDDVLALVEMVYGSQRGHLGVVQAYHATQRTRRAHSMPVLLSVVRERGYTCVAVLKWMHRKCEGAQIVYRPQELCPGG